MRRTAEVFAVAGAALVLAACNPASEPCPTPAAATEAAKPAAAPGAPQDMTAGPSGIDKFTWATTEKGANGRPRLAYVDPLTGETAMRLECDVGGAVYVTFNRPAPTGALPARWEFTLVSGAVKSENKGETAKQPNGTIDITAAMPPTDLSLSGLRDQGLMEIVDKTGGNSTQPVNAVNDAERQAAKKFFQTCTSAAPAAPAKPQ